MHSAIYAANLGPCAPCEEGAPSGTRRIVNAWEIKAWTRVVVFRQPLYNGIAGPFKCILYNLLILVPTLV